MLTTAVTEAPAYSLAGPHDIIRGKHGVFMAPRTDQYVGQALLTYGEYAEKEVALFRALLEPCERQCRVIEVGANLGAHTIPLARFAGEVIAIEPQRWVYQVLCANLALNGLHHVRALWAAAGDGTSQTIRVPMLDYQRPNNFGALELAHDWGQAPCDVVPCLRIDDIPDNDCVLLKADVEGMEEQVLRGAAGMIARCRPMLYVEADREAQRESLFDYLRELRYDIYWHRPTLFNAENYRQDTRDLWPGIIAINVLGVPSEFQMPIPLMPVLR